MSKKKTVSLSNGGDVLELSAVAIKPLEGPVSVWTSLPSHYQPPTKAREGELVKSKPQSILAFENVGYVLPKGRCHCIRRNGTQKTILQGAS